MKKNSNEVFGTGLFCELEELKSKQFCDPLIPAFNMNSIDLPVQPLSFANEETEDQKP